MAPGTEWNCHKCTFLHKYPSQRCAMCGALRVSKQEMRDFVTGASLKESMNRSKDGNAKVSLSKNNHYILSERSSSKKFDGHDANFRVSRAVSQETIGSENFQKKRKCTSEAASMEASCDVRKKLPAQRRDRPFGEIQPCVRSATETKGGNLDINDHLSSASTRTKSSGGDFSSIDKSPKRHKHERR